MSADRPGAPAEAPRHRGGCRGVRGRAARVGPRVVLALPLGVGKPNPIANEFYRRAARDPGIDLTIITALSLRKPTARTDLEKQPARSRSWSGVFGNYVELEYMQAMRRGDVPPNIRIDRDSSSSRVPGSTPSMPSSTT